MDILCCALALLGSVVGAGFASGREIVRFFAAHGAMGFVAVAFSLAALAALFLCLAERLSAAGQTGLPGLCASRFGARVGGVCTARSRSRGGVSTTTPPSSTRFTVSLSATAATPLPNFFALSSVRAITSAVTSGRAPS